MLASLLRHRYPIAATVALVLGTSVVRVSAGDPGIRVVDRQVLFENGSSRATAYGMTPKIVRYGDRTHVTYLGAGSTIWVQTLDETRGRWLPPVQIGSGTDNHADPALVVDGTGTLHLIYGPHHGPFLYRRSLRPNDPSEWSPVETFGDSATYPSMAVDSANRLHVVYRGGDWPRKALYQSRPEAGGWTPPRVLVDGGDRYMVSYFDALGLGPDQSLHVVYNFFEWDSLKGRKVGYMRSVDGGRTWQRSDGSPYRLPITFASAEAVAAGEDADLRVGNVVADEHGHAFFVVHRYETSPKSARLVRLGSDGIHSLDLNQALAAHPGVEIHGMSNTVLAPGNEIWVAAQVAQRDSEWGDPSTELFVFRTDHDLRPATATQVSETAPVNNWLPSWERWVGHNRLGIPRLMYTRGEKGTHLATQNPTQVIFLTLEPIPR